MSDTASTPSEVKIHWIIGTLLAFTIFAVVGVYSLRMTNDYPDYDQKRADARVETLKKLRAEENQALATADWVDQSKGIVRIPIDEAMARELADLKKKPAMQGNLLQPPPAAAPVPATNAPPASTNAAPAAATNAAPAAPAKEAKK